MSSFIVNPNDIGKKEIDDICNYFVSHFSKDDVKNFVTDGYYNEDYKATAGVITNPSTCGYSLACTDWCYYRPNYNFKTFYSNFNKVTSNDKVSPAIKKIIANTPYIQGIDNYNKLFNHDYKVISNTFISSVTFVIGFVLLILVIKKGIKYFINVIKYKGFGSGLVKQDYDMYLNDKVNEDHENYFDL